MNIKRKTLRWLDFVSVVGIVFTSLGWASSHYQWFTQDPFKNVTNTSAAWDVDDPTILNVRASYEITSRDCQLDPPIMVFGHTFKERVPLGYTPVRGKNQSEQRFEGPQKMHLRVDGENLIIDRVEVWTRHNCTKNGKTVSVDTLLLDEIVADRIVFPDTFKTRHPSEKRK